MINKIFCEDQKDRKNPDIRMNTHLLSQKDRARKKLVKTLLKQNSIQSGRDYYQAGMIFHHGPYTSDSIQACRLLKKSVDLGYKSARSLYACCIDRLLIKQGKPQRFGTQYRKNDSQSEWELLPIDPKTTDEERKKFNIVSLRQLKKRVDKLNKKSWRLKD